VIVHAISAFIDQAKNKSGSPFQKIHGILLKHEHRRLAVRSGKEIWLGIVKGERLAKCADSSVFTIVLPCEKIVRKIS